MKINSTSGTHVHVDETLLHRAVCTGNKGTVKYILHQEEGIVNLKNKDGQTPLHIAAENGHAEIIQMLVEEFQADVSAKNNKGKTAMNIAAENGHLEIAVMTSGESNACTKLDLTGQSGKILHIAENVCLLTVIF